MLLPEPTTCVPGAAQQPAPAPALLLPCSHPAHAAAPMGSISPSTMASDASPFPMGISPRQGHPSESHWSNLSPRRCGAATGGAEHQRGPQGTRPPSLLVLTPSPRPRPSRTSHLPA